MNSIKKGKVYTCQYPDGDGGVIVLPEVTGFLLLPLLLLFVPRFVELLDSGTYFRDFQLGIQPILE